MRKIRIRSRGFCSRQISADRVRSTAFLVQVGAQDQNPLGRILLAPDMRRMRPEYPPSRSTALAQDRNPLARTGASGGVGAAIALSLAEHGADVLITGRSERLFDTASAIERRTGRAPVVHAADVTSVHDVERLRSQAKAAFWSVGVLVNSAGTYGPLATIADSEADAWIDTLQTNTIGPYLLCRAFVGDMVEAGWGRIVNVSSAVSFAPPSVLDSTYVTSKVALNRLTRQLAAELEGTGVTANVIHPGTLMTDMYFDIKAKIANLTGHPPALDTGVDKIEATGGDSILDGIDLVVALIDGEMSEVNGAFGWPARGASEKRLQRL